MAERNCKKCFHYEACKEVASHIGYADINYTESQCKNFICADDVVPKSEVDKWFRECEELQGRLIEAVKCAEIISEKFNIPLADLVDVFAEIPTANKEDCARTPKERGGEK